MELEIVSPSAGPIIGETYVPLCNVTILDTIDSDVMVQWINPIGLTLISRTTSESTSVPLSFNPLVAADAGNYTCRATITSPPMDIPYVVEGLLNLKPTIGTGILYYITYNGAILHERCLLHVAEGSQSMCTMEILQPLNISQYSECAVK